MLSLHCNLPLSRPHERHCSAIRKHNRHLFSHRVDEFTKRTIMSSPYSSSTSAPSSVVRAEEERVSGEFELDQEEAREALRKLDQQLQTLSKKQVTPPKIKASEVNLSRAEFREEPPEISAPFLAYLTIGLIIFSIFYNVLFITVIKPAVDGPETAAAIDILSDPTGVAFLQWLPPESVSGPK